MKEENQKNFKEKIFRLSRSKLSSKDRDIQTSGNNSAFLEYFGDTPKLRFLNFLIGNHFFDFNMTDMAKEANISYNSLMSFFDEFLKKGVIIKTRRVGKSDMYKLNMDNPISKNFLKFAWFLTKQDLGIEEKENISGTKEVVYS